MTEASKHDVRRTPEQRRAAHAAATAVSVAERDSDRFKKEYRAYVDRLGPTIVINGLGQALAMERSAAGSNGDSPHGLLYANLSNWLCRTDGGVYPEARDLLTALIAGSQGEYLRAQSEALSWLQWHKNLCRAQLPRDRDLSAEDA